MRIKMYFKCVIIMITIVVTGAYGQNNQVAEPDVKVDFRDTSQYYRPDNYNQNYLPRLHNQVTSKANYKPLFWGVEIDLKKMRQKNIASTLKLIPIIDKFSIVDYEKIPKEIAILQMSQGYKHNEILTTIIHGDFNDFSATAFFDKFLARKYESDKFSVENKFKILGGTVSVHTVRNTQKKYGQKIKKIYIGRLKNLIVFSHDLQEVKHWFSEPNAPLIISNEKVNNNVFLQFFLKGGFDLDSQKHLKNQRAYESNIFRKAKNIHLIISESNNELFIGALISAKNNKVAKNIAQVLDGIVAVNSLSKEMSTDTLKQQMFEQSAISCTDNVVKIGTSLKLDDINKYGMKKQK